MIYVYKHIWKKIPDYPLYEVSNFGLARSYNHYYGKREKPHFLSLCTISKRGYQSVQLSNKKGIYNRKLIHRLVLITFVGPPLNNKIEGAHGDRNPRNNCLYNLRWATSKENGQDMIEHGMSTYGIKNPQAKLDNKKVLEIRGSTLPDSILATAYCVSKGLIWQIRNNRIWRHLL